MSEFLLNIHKGWDKVHRDIKPPTGAKKDGKDGAKTEGR